MIKVCMNIGGGNGHPYNNIPMFWEMQNAREFTNFIREEMFNIILWSHENYGQPNSLWLGIHIEDDSPNSDGDYFFWDFIVKCKNIREFKDYAKMDRDEIDALKSKLNRESAINNILE